MNFTALEFNVLAVGRGEWLNEVKSIKITWLTLIILSIIIIIIINYINSLLINIYYLLFINKYLKSRD